jgi:transposase
VRSDHPLRAIREIVNTALALRQRKFAVLYTPRIGRPSIEPEKLLWATLLQALYSIRSERQLMGRMECDLLSRWFTELGIDDAAWGHSTFTKNRVRSLERIIAAQFLAAMLAQLRVKKLLSTDHFSIDGTLIEAWTSIKSFKTNYGPGDPPADGGRNTEANFQDDKRSDQTHASTTDPDGRLYRKGAGKGAKLCLLGHALVENRSRLVVGACLTQANGYKERGAALALIEPYAAYSHPVTLGADKAFDTQDFVHEVRAMRVTPHVAQKTSGRRSALDGRTTRHAGYAVSQRIRKRIEEVFSWIKTVAGQEKTRFRGGGRVELAFAFAAAYNLVRLPKLLGSLP